MKVILYYFFEKYEGNWDKIYKALDTKEKVSLNELTEVEKRMSAKSVTTLLDLEYPRHLKEAYKPSFVMETIGNNDLLEKRGVAVISETVTEVTSERIGQFLPKIANSTPVVISISEEGISEAQKEIIKASTGVIAYSSCGLKNVDLKGLIGKNYLVISEYPEEFKTTPESKNAVNRLVAANSNSMIIMDSIKNSKSTNSLVNNHLNLGKEIYCFPGDGSTLDGNSELIKRGANLITSSKDISSKEKNVLEH